MDEEELFQMDPNTADEQTLQRLPGIGPALAKRILAARPFMDAEDMLRIAGLGKASLERIRPFLAFSKERSEELLPPEGKAIVIAEEILPEESTQALPMEEGQIEGAFPQQSALPAQTEKLDVFPEKEAVKNKPGDDGMPEKRMRPKEKPFRRADMLWPMVGIGAVAMILSILINLAILGGINGTLDFNRLDAIQQLDADLDLLTRNLDTLNSDLETLEQRVKPLEGLSGRMTAVEEQVDTLQDDMEQAVGAVAGMQTELQRLSDEATRLTGRVGVFDSFLEGLNRLLGELFASASSQGSPETQE